MVKLFIDGIEVEVEEEATVMQAASKIGIDIPSLCYDEYLKPFGGCRLCLVEIEGSKKMQTACSTKVREGMVVKTETPRLANLRYEILDLLMMNHPKDCLTCDKVGNCRLQDLCFRYNVRGPEVLGKYRGHDVAVKNHEVDTSNPLMIRDQNKCIMCGKCVRVCDEIQVTHTIDYLKRGFESYIGTAMDLPLMKENCRMCGQCVGICPTGALLNKQLCGTRPWEIKKVTTTCPFCGTGCSFDLNVKNGKVVGITPNNGVVNQNSLCIKGRFHTDMIHSDERLTAPLMKKDGKFVEVSWEEAISFVGNKLKEIKETYGPDSIAGLSSARCTNEDNFVFQKMMRAAIGTNNVDHCART